MRHRHRLYGLRGQAYVREYKRILAEDGDRIRQRFEEIRAEQGKFTPPDLGRLCVEFQLPVSGCNRSLTRLSSHTKRVRYGVGIPVCLANLKLPPKS